ncbi:hypothetical protein ACQP3L_35545, partial [Escherichia coli]
ISVPEEVCYLVPEALLRFLLMFQASLVLLAKKLQVAESEPGRFLRFSTECDLWWVELTTQA